jgi:hypothetical protein
LDQSTFPLTQEFLSHMLGVRRTSVSLRAHTLQKSGLIQYAHGNIKIQNRKGLEECACECYSAIHERIFGVGQASAAMRAKAAIDGSRSHQRDAPALDRLVPARARSNSESPLT